MSTAAAIISQKLSMTASRRMLPAVQRQAIMKKN